ncbi:MAG: cytochrome bc complex cytochrome b subunit [Calditrichaeota bacterium]|nr:cytochrome bc complex cytochrome b subunit [Calditrichota bacterium]
MKNNKIFQWLHERYNLEPILEFVEHKQVPMHKHSIWYYTGGITLFLFIIQVCTGILLLFYYQPGVDSSYESVRFLMTKVNFGWLIRSIHSWSANLMVFFAFIHMFSVFFSEAFKKPRELTWVSGFLMLLLAMGFGFSGYLLPWNELAFFATKVGTDIVGDVPVVGELIKQLLRGGPDVTGSTIYRFYAIHVSILPLIFLVVLGLHLLFIQRQGMHEPEFYESLPPEEKHSIPFFPNFFLRDLLFWLLILDVLLFLAVFFPWELGIKADLFSSAPAGIRPEWYFMFMFQSLKMIPAKVLGIEGEILGIVFFGILGLLWLTVPFWETVIAGKKRPWLMKVIGLLAIIYMIALTIIGYLV